MQNGNGSRDEEKIAESSISFIYRVKVGDSHRNVTTTWSKSVVNHSFTVTVENLSAEDNNHYICKIDLKAWQSWGKKGLKTIEIDNIRVDIFWDFRKAKFSVSPKACSDYYFALVSEQEVVLLLGDLKIEALKRTRKSLASQEATLLCRKEHVYGKRLFCTKAVLDESDQEHDVVIETCLSGPDEPEMWINIDGTVACRIMNLNWRFRGNEALTINDVPIDIFWDVHDWLFDASGTSSGLFIFKRGGLGLVTSENDTDDEVVPDCCHVLYAWKID